MRVDRGAGGGRAKHSSCPRCLVKRACGNADRVDGRGDVEAHCTMCVWMSRFAARTQMKRGVEYFLLLWHFPR